MTTIDIYGEEESISCFSSDNRNEMQLIEFIVAFVAVVTLNAAASLMSKRGTRNDTEQAIRILMCNVQSDFVFKFKGIPEKLVCPLVVSSCNV